eukprot:3662833-Alexandrium_andersonii.AAC.1
MAGGSTLLSGRRRANAGGPASWGCIFFVPVVRTLVAAFAFGVGPVLACTLFLILATTMSLVATTTACATRMRRA